MRATQPLVDRVRDLALLGITPHVFALWRGRARIIGTKATAYQMAKAGYSINVALKVLT